MKKYKSNLVCKTEKRDLSGHFDRFINLMLSLPKLIICKKISYRTIIPEYFRKIEHKLNFEGEELSRKKNMQFSHK